MTPVNVGKNFDFIQKNLKFLFRARFKKKKEVYLLWKDSVQQRLKQTGHIFCYFGHCHPQQWINCSVLIKQRTCLITGAVASA